MQGPGDVLDAVVPEILELADESILLLLNDVRGKTLKILEDLSDAQARFTPMGLNNTIH